MLTSVESVDINGRLELSQDRKLDKFCKMQMNLIAILIQHLHELCIKENPIYLSYIHTKVSFHGSWPCRKHR